ncbi:MGMT family protein [Motiliproteus sediminis]|uniref:MGMT family protein n=1 Tax=Motiliproteus sediminis TaxID=1468178 RepID=UPI001AEF3AB0|nr:MGMT family protein [Motiliproteus sediminis]
MSESQQRQQQLLQTLAAVPFGRVVTYGQLAELAGLPRAARLVGSTLKKLPADTTLPWHRVINASGRISFPIDSDGYRRQRARLLDEGIEIQGNRVSLTRYRWQP